MIGRGHGPTEERARARASVRCQHGNRRKLRLGDSEDRDRDAAVTVKPINSSLTWNLEVSADRDDRHRDRGTVTVTQSS